VSVPRRLLNGEEVSGYLMMSHKRPSALDHARVSASTLFVGRERELAIIEACYRQVEARATRLAIIASAGSGKTRLIAEWRRLHPEVHSLTANFSLFGGDIESFASQLAELPPDRLDQAALVEAVVARLRREKVKALVLDDLHWAGPGGINFLRLLIAALSPSDVLVILAARPSGRHLMEAFGPTSELTLEPLPAPAVKELARRLATSAAVASAAALRSHGNPLFLEQFVAWATEANFNGGEGGPQSLHEIIAARIRHLRKNRLEDIRLRWRWGGSWLVHEELEQLEREIGLWLDRLETGDYSDRLEAACHLNQLERLEYEIFILSAAAGRARPRSSRLREAIERLLIGSANEILTDLKRRGAEANGADKENVAREAQRAGNVLFDAGDWRLARNFYQLALSSNLWERSEIAQRLSQCRRHSQAAITEDGEVYSAHPQQDLEQKPSVDSLDLPYIWAELGRRFRSSNYFLRASKAAQTIQDAALAAWATRKAHEMDAKK
jgi:AAA ATPase domain